MPERRELWAVYDDDKFFCLCDGVESAMESAIDGLTVHRFIEVLPDGDPCGECEGTGIEGPNKVFTMETCQTCGGTKLVPVTEGEQPDMDPCSECDGKDDQ